MLFSYAWLPRKVLARSGHSLTNEPPKSGFCPIMIQGSVQHVWEKSNKIFVSILPNLFDGRAGFDQTQFFMPNSSTNEKPAMCLALLFIAVCFLDRTGLTVDVNLISDLF